MIYTNKHISKGFTLVEISIALVIISLLVAGTLVGRDLVRNAAIKSIIYEVEELKAAMSQFELMYERIPGDMANATSYWSGSANGNGDNLIAIETSDEPFLAFEHLSNAKMVDAIAYSGVWGAGFDSTTKTNAGNVYSFSDTTANMYPVCCLNSFYARTTDYNNNITVFSIFSSDDDKRDGAFTPIEARSIDKKMDDGLPDFGFIGASGAWTGSAYEATGCYTGTGDSSAYASADASLQNEEGCQVHFAYDWD